MKSEIDTQEVEVIFDDGIDNETHTCEICGIDKISTLDFLIHMKEKHKMVVKYQEYECKICSELFLSKTCCDKHVVSHDGSEITPMLLDCCAEKPYMFKAREHVMEKHGEEMDRFVKELGWKCRFCEEYFWENSERNRHEVGEHLVDNTSEFLKCPLCMGYFSDQVCIVFFKITAVVNRRCRHLSSAIYQY